MTTQRPGPLVEVDREQSTIRIGMCSWAAKSLVQSGEFYPKGANTAEGRLRYYASMFDVVEVDSSYYAIPAEKTVDQWAERTPDGFVFHVKAYALLTGHGADLRSVPLEVRDMLSADALGKDRITVREKAPLEAAFMVFKKAFRPLKEAGKMGITVFQYPQQFIHKHENLDYILFCREAMGDWPIGVEFRNGSWLAPETRKTVFTFLREHGIAYIAADEPQYGNLATVPFIPEATTDTAYFRLHGRNKETWLKKGIETSLRYDYSYPDDELKEFVPPVLEVSKRVGQTFVMFNNHGSPAIRNAAALRRMLRQRADAAGVS
jgi:uncharacterized protein YecE (DUF72 family)